MFSQEEVRNHLNCYNNFETTKFIENCFNIHCEK